MIRLSTRDADCDRDFDNESEVAWLRKRRAAGSPGFGFRPETTEFLEPGSKDPSINLFAE
jgi:hypothetical protein